jgi:polar amino acid transport system substrate-binding protein
LHLITKFIASTLLLLASLAADDLKSVSLQLQWKYQFQFAGYIIAKEKGFYKRAGLDVTLKEWNNNIDMVDEVIMGRSEYAVSRPSSLINISQGKEIVYLAVIFQSSPLILLTDKSSGITSVKDFKNKRVMTTGDLNTDTSLLSMMYSQGISLEDIVVQKPSFNVKDLLDHKTDLAAAYISNEPYILKELGGDPVMFRPIDYGFDFYNDILITGQNYLADNPQEVKSFKDATLEGWEYAFAHIDEAVELIYNNYNTQNKSKEALLYEAKELKSLAYYKSNKIGKIERDKLEKIYDVYKLLGLLDNEIDFNQVIFNDTSLDVTLNAKEKEYLKNKGSIRMCIDPNWMPYESFDSNGKYVGMTAEYYRLFEKILGVKFELVRTTSWSESIAFAKERKCDIFSLAMQTPERQEYMDFTTPFLSVPLVITTKLDVPFVNDIQDLSGHTVGISKGYAFVEILRHKYPKLNIIEVDDIDDGLDRVNEGEIFAYIGTLASVGYKFQNRYAGELKIAGKVDDNWELGIGVRNDDKILLNILQIAVNNITSDQRRAILNKWVSIKYERGVDYTLLYKTIAVFILVLSIILYFYNRQRGLKQKLETAYAELQEVAVTDRLTKVYNRHKLDETLATEKKKAQRYGTTFAIVILDIDHFKRVNDNYGHYAGDEVLVEFVEVLLDHSRDTDIIGRWGGEEFLIIVPQASAESIVRFANLLKENIENHSFKTVDSITASIGVTSYIPGESIETTVRRADEALYVSKNNGRNQVSYR